MIRVRVCTWHSFHRLQYSHSCQNLQYLKVSTSSPLPESIRDSAPTFAHSSQIHFSAKTQCVCWCILTFQNGNYITRLDTYRNWSQPFTLVLVRCDVSFLRMIYLTAIGCWHKKCCCHYVRYQTCKCCWGAYWQRYLQWKIPLNCDSCLSMMRGV